MLSYLHEVADRAILIPGNAGSSVSREQARRRKQLDTQLSLARRAILMLKSLHADVSALRVADGDGFQGTGSCEGVDVTLDWPNLALLIDETKSILDAVAKADVRTFWFVWHGDCSTAFRCEADNPDQAMELCAETHPGSPIHAAVLGNEFGGLVMYGYGEEMVHCPLCGSRTEFNELPRENWQCHHCLKCKHAFIAVPAGPEEDDAVEAETACATSVQPRVADGVGEVIADIAFTAGHLMGTGRLAAFPDSREMMAHIICWATEFEASFDKDRHGDDYMELVDDYATYRLLGEHDKAQQLLAKMKQVQA